MNKVRRAIGSSITLTLAIILLAGSAVTGNVFQGVGRADLKAQLNDANQRIEDLEEQIDTSSGEQECRSRIASAAELQAGRILVGIADIVIAAREGDDDLAESAVVTIASARKLLGPALDARQHAVELCKNDPDYRVPTETFTEVTLPTTTTTVAAARRTTSTTRRPSTSTTGTTTTTFRSSPTPTDPACELLPGLTVPREIPCL